MFGRSKRDFIYVAYYRHDSNIDNILEYVPTFINNLLISLSGLQANGILLTPIHLHQPFSLVDLSCPEDSPVVEGSHTAQYQE